MLSVVAAAFEDGWAFVRHGDRIYLVRPPYHGTSRLDVSPETVERAVQMHGFQAVKEDFADWGAVVRFLRNKLDEAAAERGARLDDAVQRLLRKAPRPVLVRYLDRVEREMMPAREWRAAIDLLDTLRDLDQVDQDADLRRRAKDLRRRCVEASKARDRERAEMLDDKDELSRLFPFAVGAHGYAPIKDLVQTVQERHQILAVCG